MTAVCYVGRRRSSAHLFCLHYSLTNHTSPSTFLISLSIYISMCVCIYIGFRERMVYYYYNLTFPASL